jgi:hypothetical protein
LRLSLSSDGAFGPNQPGRTALARGHRGRRIAIFLTPSPEVRTRLDSSPGSWPIARIDHMILHEWRRYRANQTLGCILLAVVTAEMIARVVLLITRLPVHRDTPRQLLTAALGIWWSNVLILASWYWRLDSGGPNARDRRKKYRVFTNRRSSAIRAGRRQ